MYLVYLFCQCLLHINTKLTAIKRKRINLLCVTFHALLCVIYDSSYAKLFQSGKKGKAVPLQRWGGPEGSRKLRFPDYMTTAQDGGKIVSLTHWLPLPPGNAPGTHFC